MKFSEAMKALEEGKWISRKHFDRFKPIRNLSEMAFFLADCCVDEIASHLNAEWEFYEEPKRTYSFSEVVQGLKEGKRFKRPNWEHGKSFGRASYDYDYARISLYGGEPWDLTISDFEATDWEEVK